MNYLIEPERKLPVTEADVFVAGAGTAGCIAAISAARAGAKVVLVEKLAVPGGTFCNGGIGINSYYACTEDPANAKRIAGGIAYELAERLEKAGGATGFLLSPNDHYHSPYRFVADHEIHKGVVSEMLMEAGVRVLLQTMFCGLVMDGSHIQAAIIENKDGRSAIAAKQYIDCSGDGDVAKFAGVEQVEIWQDYDKVCGGPTGLVFGMAGIDFERLLSENRDGAFALGTTGIEGAHCNRRVAFTHKKNPQKFHAFQDLDINFFTNIQSIHDGEATYINNSRGSIIDGSNAADYSKAEMENRIKIMKMAQAFRECVPGCEKSYISWASTQLGVRASKVTICDKILTQEEISNAARFDDEIGLYAFHDLSPKNKELMPKEPGFYGLPYRMLLAKGIENLYMAGRCVTVDINAHMSTRNTVGCMLMGHGAGAAAALCARENCTTRELPYEKLRALLLEQGAILN